jgi:protoporphyrinogen oxidase
MSTQNEKTLGISLERLSPQALRRFFPEPDDAKIRLGATGARRKDGYNTRFWYPKQGGIQKLVDGLAKGIDHLILNQRAVAIDPRRRTVRLSNGREFAFRHLISSIPLKALCGIIADEELKAMAHQLSHSTTITVCLGIQGELCPELAEAHWIYVPDRRLPFYRVGCYSNVSDSMAAAGCHSLYVELGVASDDTASGELGGCMESRVLAWLQELGWIDIRQVLCCVTHRIDCAYVHLTPEREQVVPAILRRLHAVGIFPIGRYGLWDYTSMEDSIISGVETVEALT